MRCGSRAIGWLAFSLVIGNLNACGGRPGGLPISELQPAPTATVRPGDVIQIEFWQQPELTGERIVDRSGNIHLPLLRSVHVAGLDAEEVQARLTERYSDYYADPLIVVNVRLGVSVTGEVRQPARYTVDPAFNVLDVIGLAGGLLFDAKRDEIELNRGGQRYIIDIDRATLLTDSESLRLQSGDWIYVPRSFWTLQRTATYLSAAAIIISTIAIIDRI
ncbi:MAG: polysaccharide export protein [Gemmatimonadetes bacterium]|uniref:Polysaccharide export protein n=1 Tax=Candidatus Kutchimonas denitrificans TaxID=3056748 RepID=A0AAE4Z8A0_9BACT|nr:polysaccharide export protein [Gemmatimonadota bacterium]NIR74317.1 polysaccharide export protein [Candidatus Kutchimonas denitrificans]NIS01373.1 polysaccharide export protein [Gemmatimonadota bacterium]NIT67113.1 polysaccharide export protein [Gemmatimonadota bacterium]NIU52769.1 hypothetical protein [Gemmatimonadota bacterium]